MRPAHRDLRFKTKSLLLLPAALLTAGLLHAEVCTTQSQMKPADRESIAAAARNFAAIVQANDAAMLRQQTVPKYATDLSTINALVGNTAAKIKGATLVVDQVYLLDATNLKTLADGTNQDAQFFCSLNKSIAEASFLIPSLPPGRYAFAIVSADGAATPWRLSFLLKQNGTADASSPNPATWSMAGFYPKPRTAAGHDGVWYWTQARELAKAKQHWSAYLYYQEAQTLLEPVGFVSSTHLENLRKEAAVSAPPVLSDGISADVPLVVKGPKNSEYRFTDLTTDDSLGANKLDVLVHLEPEPPADPPSADAPKSASAKSDAAKASATPPLSPSDRNSEAMAALLAAYPELRNNFHGVWVFADSPGGRPFVTEQPMAEIH